MTTRKRYVTDKKRPAFKLTRIQSDPEEQDLKKVKARIIKELKENDKKKEEWYDNELNKNLKK